MANTPEPPVFRSAITYTIYPVNAVFTASYSSNDGDSFTFTSEDCTVISDHLYYSSQTVNAIGTTTFTAYGNTQTVTTGVDNCNPTVIINSNTNLFSFILYGPDMSTESVILGDGTSISTSGVWNDTDNGWHIDCDLSSDTSFLMIKTSGFEDYEIDDFTITDVTLIPKTDKPTHLYCYECEPISRTIYTDNKNPQPLQNVYDNNGICNNEYVADNVNNTISISKRKVLWRYGNVYLPKNPVISDSVYMRNLSTNNIEITTKYTIVSIEQDYTDVTLLDTESGMNYTYYRNVPYEYAMISE